MDDEPAFLQVPLLTEWDDNEAFEPGAQNETRIEEPDERDELVEEMRREEARDEARRNAAAGVKEKPKKAARAKKPTSAPAKRRGKRGGGAAGAPSKVQKMRAKHMRNAMRDAERIVESAVHDNETEDIRNVRVEAQHAQQQAIAAMRELRMLTESATKTKEALKIHSDMSAKYRRLKQMNGDHNKSSSSSTAAYEAMSEMILSDCIEVFTQQAATITLLHERINKLVRLYSENTAKCEATTRRFFDASVQFATSIPIANGRLHAAVAISDSQNAQTEPPPEAEEAAERSDSLFSLRTRNGFMQLTTRSAPQITRGTPGAHYMWHSIARRKGSVQQMSQSNTITRVHNVQRLAKLTAKKRAFDDLILALPHLNGDDELQRLEAPKLAQITGDDGASSGALVPAKRARKKK